MSNAAFKRRNAELRALRAANAALPSEVTERKTYTQTGVRVVAGGMVEMCVTYKDKRTGEFRRTKRLVRSGNATVTTRTVCETVTYRTVEPRTSMGENPNYNWTGPRLGMM